MTTSDRYQQYAEDRPKFSAPPSFYAWEDRRSFPAPRSFSFGGGPGTISAGGGGGGGAPGSVVVSVQHSHTYGDVATEGRGEEQDGGERPPGQAPPAPPSPAPSPAPSPGPLIPFRGTVVPAVPAGLNGQGPRLAASRALEMTHAATAAAEAGGW